MWADLQRGLFWGHYTPERLKACLAEVELEEGTEAEASQDRERALRHGGGTKLVDPEDVVDVDVELPPTSGRRLGAASPALSCGRRTPGPLAQRALTPSRGTVPRATSRASAAECCSPGSSRTDTLEAWSLRSTIRSVTSPSPRAGGGRPARRRQDVVEAVPSSVRAARGAKLFPAPKRPPSVCTTAAVQTPPSTPKMGFFKGFRQEVDSHTLTNPGLSAELPAAAECDTAVAGAATDASSSPRSRPFSPPGPQDLSPSSGRARSPDSGSFLRGRPTPRYRKGSPDFGAQELRHRGITEEEPDFVAEAGGLVTKTNMELAGPVVTHTDTEHTTSGRSHRLSHRFSVHSPDSDLARMLESPQKPRARRRQAGASSRWPPPVPEVSASTAETIRLIVCGSGPAGPSKLPVEKQTTFTTDDVAKGARELSGWERARVAATFREFIVPSDDRKETKPEHVAVSSSEVARRLRGMLSNAHIQRFCHYFGLPKRVRLDAYMKRVALLITSTKEKRLRICFGLLDVDGDGVLGPRDVFAALGSSKGPAAGSSDVVDACFEDPGPVGIDFEEPEPGSAKPVRDVARVAPTGPAHEKGVQPGDRLTHINGVAVETLVPHEVRQRLRTFARPLRLRFERQGKQPGGVSTGIFAFSDFEKMLEALRAQHRTTTRIRVTIVGAKGLRQADGGAGSKSDPYCICEAQGKPTTKFRTKVVNDCLDPQWNEERFIADYSVGDTLRFTVRDRDVGSSDELLGRASLQSRQFMESGFDGELQLSDAGRGVSASLHVKVAVIGEGGIGYQQFSEVFSQQGLAFFAPLTKALTGLTPETGTPNKTVPASGVKLKVRIVSASSLRDADLIGKSDPYCVCEVVGKPGSRFQTKTINDNLDPVWNARGELADFTPGDEIRFSVFDRDPGANGADECLGQARLLSSQFLPNGYEGELLLADLGGGGKDDGHPSLRIKITPPGAPARRASQALSISSGADAAMQAATEANAAAMQRFEEQHRELSGLPSVSEAAAGWYRRSFEALADYRKTLRRDLLIAAAPKLLGVPSGLLAGRLFELLDPDRQGEVGILAWGTVLERFHAGRPAEHNYQKVALAVALYDLDGDGVIGAEDASRLAQEVERLEALPAAASSLESEALCEEMRFIYGLIADRLSADQVFGGASGLILDTWMFHQMRPQPALADTLLGHLSQLAGPDPEVLASPSLGPSLPPEDPGG